MARRPPPPVAACSALSSLGGPFGPSCSGVIGERAEHPAGRRLFISRPNPLRRAHAAKNNDSFELELRAKQGIRPNPSRVRRARGHYLIIIIAPRAVDADACRLPVGLRKRPRPMLSGARSLLTCFRRLPPSSSPSVAAAAAAQNLHASARFPWCARAPDDHFFNKLLSCLPRPRACAVCCAQPARARGWLSSSACCIYV